MMRQIAKTRLTGANRPENSDIQNKTEVLPNKRYEPDEPSFCPYSNQTPVNEYQPLIDEYFVAKERYMLLRQKLNSLGIEPERSTIH